MGLSELGHLERKGPHLATSASTHVRRHLRFYLSATLGLATWWLARSLALPVRLTVAGDVFFGAYLVSTMSTTARVTPDWMRERAASKDEGITVIVLLTLAAVGLSLGSIFALLNASEKPHSLQLLLSLVSVPLGWTTLHTVMAFHYAHLFYARHPSSDLVDEGGLIFPETREPGLWDFLYYSFVVGMTAQVSDVQVASTAMRQTTLVHGMVSFFVNTVILALAVNVALGLAR